MLSGEFAESELKDFSTPIDEDEQAKNYDFYSDSDLEEDKYPQVQKVGDVTSKYTNGAGESMLKRMVHRQKNNPVLQLFSASDAPAYEDWSDEPSGKGSIFTIHDVSFITYAPSNVYRHAANEFADFRPF